MPLSFFTISILIARVLGVQTFGAYTIVVSYYALFRIFSNFGIDSFLLREIPRDVSKSGFYLNHAFFAGIVFSALNILLINSVFYLVGYSFEIRLSGFIISLALLPDCLNKHTESFFTGLGKSWYAFFTVLIRECLKIFFAAMVLWTYKSLPLVMAAITVSYYFGFCVNVALLGRLFGRQKFYLHHPTLFWMLRVSSWIAFIGATNSLFLSTDVIVLSKLRGETVVGFYTAAGKFVTLAFLFIDSIGTALFPILSNLYHASEAEFKKLSRMALQYLTAGLFLFIAIIWCFSDFWIAWIFGEKFLASASILRVLIWVVLFLGNSYFIGRLLFIANAQKYDFIAISAVCVLNGVLSYFCTRQWGTMGTAAATLISVIFLFLAHFYFFRSKVFTLCVFEIWSKPVIAAVFFFVVFGFVSRWNLTAAFAAALCGYYAVLVKLRVLPFCWKRVST